MEPDVNMEFACYKNIYFDFFLIFEILLLHVDMSKFNNFASTELYADFAVKHTLENFSNFKKKDFAPNKTFKLIIIDI